MAKKGSTDKSQWPICPEGHQNHPNNTFCPECGAKKETFKKPGEQPTAEPTAPPKPKGPEQWLEVHTSDLGQGNHHVVVTAIEDAKGVADAPILFLIEGALPHRMRTKEYGTAEHTVRVTRPWISISVLWEGTGEDSGPISLQGPAFEMPENPGDVYGAITKYNRERNRG